MKKVAVYGCAFFQSLCLTFLNRRKRMQEKKRLLVLRRLEQLPATAE